MGQRTFLVYNLQTPPITQLTSGRLPATGSGIMFVLWWLWDFGRGEQALHKLVFIHRLHKARVIRRPLGLALKQNKPSFH